MLFIKIFKIHKGFPFIVLCLSFLMTSCFTGIESTKKISLSREDKKRANPTPEERLMQQIEAIPLKDWEEGRSFVAADDKALVVIIPERGISPIPPDSVKGKILQFAGVESKINAAGNLVVAILFSDGEYIYSYNTGKEFDDAMSNLKSDQIPMMIDEEMVAEAKLLLTGRKAWSRSDIWYDALGNRIDGRKYVEVEIVDVRPGNMIFPLWVEIRTPENEKAFLFMNFGSADNESRAFHNLFSLSDIRKHYPNVSPETWDIISRGKVKEGMTKEEVKLSLGNPTDISSGHDYSQTLDIWKFDNGRVIWFVDDRVTRIRE